MKTVFFVFLMISLTFFAASLFGQTSNLNENSDVIIQAMKDEMDRSMKSLKTENMEKPYFIEYTIWDNWRLIIDGTLGSLTQARDRRYRTLRVGVRVGDYKFDNSAFFSRNLIFSSSIGEYSPIVIEDDYNAIRRKLWLNTDNVYKQALEQLAAKKAFLKNQAQGEEVPDLSKEESVQKVAPIQTLKVDRAKWEKIIKELSAIFRKFPAINESGVKLDVSVVNKYYTNSEGTVFCQPNPLVSLKAHASTQASDGMKLKHYVPFYAQTVEGLPNIQELTSAVQKMAEELTALASAKVVDKYIGPVLFTQQASAELFAQLLAPNFSGQRPPLSDMPQMDPFDFSSKLAQRLNLRVLPKDISIIDDPTQTQFQNTPLLGSYVIDDEGVVVKPVKLVDKGSLKALLMSRRPRKEFLNSNGHGRISFWGNVGVHIGNLLITSDEAKTYQQMKDELILICKSQDLPFGIIIKTLDNPFITGVNFAESLYSSGRSQSGEQGLSAPILMYRVYVADGREELIRGLSVGELPVTKLKDIASVGNDYYVLNREMPLFVGVSGTVYSVLRLQGENGIPASIVAPSVLFEDLELKKAAEKQKKPPLLPNPVFSK